MTYFEHGYALLIGVDANAVSKWALPDVAKDVTALHEVLVHAERCAYPAENVKVLTGKSATRQGILDGLEWLGEQIQKDPQATAVIYYTGHGLRDTTKTPPDFYFIPYDVKETGFQTRALRAPDFAAEIAGLQPQRLLVILDCCHAAGMSVKGPGMQELPSGYVSAALPPETFMKGEPGTKGLDALAQGHGRAVLSASTGEQSSYIRSDRKMSIFTYHLIEALTGHAQPKEGAKEVLVSDVMSHVTRKVPASAQADCGKEQTPDYQVSGNFPIALLLGGKGLSKGQPAPEPGNLHETASVPTTVPAAFNQTGQTVYGSQTNIDGDVHGAIFSGQFHGPVAAGGGDAVDLRRSQGAVYKPSGPVEQHFGERNIKITGDGNVIGNHNRVNVNKSQTTGMTVDEFRRLLHEVESAIAAARMDPDVAEKVAGDVRAAVAQAEKPKPNGAIIGAKLNSVLGMLATADGVWGLVERVQRLLAAAQSLF